MATGDYKQMWEDFAGNASARYLKYKFQPTYRVGLTNYLREEMIYNFLDPQASDIVLDAGCASGRQLFQIKDKIKSGYGTDIAANFIKQANQYKAENKADNLSFQMAILEQLPFPDAGFDKIICAEVLEHVDDNNIALKELLRVLKPGGHLIISVPNMNADATWWGRMLRFFGLRRFVPFDKFSTSELDQHGDAHVREFTKQSLSAWLEDNNLKILDITSVSFIDGPWGDKIIKIPLHIKFLQGIIIKLEMALTRAHLFWGRHLVLKAKKL